jgi:hypothetical protein
MIKIIVPAALLLSPPVEPAQSEAKGRTLHRSVLYSAFATHPIVGG